ncbi:MAG: tyrosine-type recombinase/integrase [Treponema sp.]|nr:tyrosine-type recombinase/integrase [Treponema sp.]
MINNYLTYCKEHKKLSGKSTKAYAIDLEQFRRQVTTETMPVKTDISAYIAYLHKMYKPRTVKRKIASIRAFMNFLDFEEIIADNPMKKIKTKFQEPQVLPRTISLSTIESILTVVYQEMKKAQTAYAFSSALRNIAIIELLFATGIRVSELCSLNIENIDLHNGNIRIMGKGKKERILQLGNQEVISVLRRYTEENVVHMNKSECFFVNRLSSRISEQSVRFLIKRLCAKVNIAQKITPHMFRHSFATLLLEEDVDIRYIQHMLGHSSIVTTQIYTKVAMEKQRQILTDKHPRNRISAKM